MNWIDKITEGMKLISEGCKENTEWTKCYKNCPFTNHCYMIEIHTQTTPDEEDWFDIPNVSQN